MISRLTCLDRRVSNRIIESVRTFTPEQHGIDERVLARPVYAFGKWIILTVNSVNFGSVNQKSQINVWTSSTGSTWSKEQTIFEFGSFPDQPVINFSRALQFADGVIVGFGLRYQVTDAFFQSNHSFLVVTCNDGTNWNVTNLPANPSIFAQTSTQTDLVTVFYVNGLAVFRAISTSGGATVWAKATAAANFQDLQTIPALQPGPQNHIFRFFEGFYYGHTWSDTPYVATLVRTQNFEIFEAVTFPYTAGRVFYLSGKFNPFVGVSESPDFLWTATVEPNGSQYIIWIWRTLDGVNWEVSQLPDNLRAATNVTGDVFLQLVQAAGSIVIRYDSTGYGIGSLVTTNYGTFMEIPYKSFSSVDRVVSPGSLYPAIIWYTVQPSGLSNINVTP